MADLLSDLRNHQTFKAFESTLTPLEFARSFKVLNIEQIKQN